MCVCVCVCKYMRSIYQHTYIKILTLCISECDCYSNGFFMDTISLKSLVVAAKPLNHLVVLAKVTKSLLTLAAP